MYLQGLFYLGMRHFQGCRDAGLTPTDQRSAEEGKHQGDHAQGEQSSMAADVESQGRESYASFWRNHEFPQFPPHLCAQGHLWIGFGPELMTFSNLIPL